jgi:hypothetical protein
MLCDRYGPLFLLKSIWGRVLQFYFPGHSGRTGRPHQMENSFYILINIKTPRGFERLARFYLGDREEPALRLFDQLKGNEERIDDCILQFDLINTKNNLPVNIKVFGCTLEELAENCKTITKEAFKIFALES